MSFSLPLSLSLSLCVDGGREFEKLYRDREHVEVAHKAAQEASRQAMNNPRTFSRPSVLSALATAMIPSLSVAIRYWEQCCIHCDPLVLSFTRSLYTYCFFSGSSKV